MTKKNSKLKGVAGTAVTQTIGIDLGDRSSVYCKLSSDGEVMEEGSFQNTAESIGETFRRHSASPNCAGSRRAICVDQPRVEKVRS